MKTIDLEQTAEMEAEVTSRKTGELADPDDPDWRVLTPGDELAGPEVVKVSKGKYIALYDPTEWGEHLFLFRGKGEHRVAGESRFMVRKPKVPRE